MKTSISRAIVLGTVAAAALSNVWATDVGVPTYSTDIGKNASLEIYYEKYERDIKMTVPGYDLSGRTRSRAARIMYTVEGKQEEDRFMVRLNYNASTSASLHAEVGVTDSDQSDGSVPIIGVGLKLKVYDSEALQASFFASGTFVTEIEYSEDGYISYYADVPNYSQKENYFEINGGLALSRLIQLDEKTTFTPYGGFMVSKLDGDVDYQVTWSDGYTQKDSGKIKDDGVFSLFAGLGLTMDKTFGVRIEGRFVNQSTFSAGLMYFF